MAVDFDSANSQRLTFDPGTDFDNMTAITVAIWVSSSTYAAGFPVFTKWHYSSDRGWLIGYSSIVSKYIWEVAYDDTESTDLVQPTTTQTTTDIWYHVVGIWTTTSRNIYVDGAAGTANTASHSTISDSVEDIRIAAQGDSATRLDGRAEHATIWDVALSAAEIAALAGGLHPLRVRPANIKFYVPLYTTSYINDLSGAGYAGTFVGSGSLANANGAPVAPLTFGNLWRPGVTVAGADRSLAADILLSRAPVPVRQLRI